MDYRNILQVESGNRHIDPRTGRPVVNPKSGATGAAQLMPGTARDPGFGIQPARDDSEAENRRVGEQYFNAMVQRYGGDKEKAAAAYNWGPGNVDKATATHGPNWKSVLPTETSQYLVKTGASGSAAQAPQAQGVNLQPFVDAGWGAEIEFAKSNGIDEGTILKKLTEAQKDLRAQSQAKATGDERVAVLGAQGKHIEYQLQALRDAGWADEIEFAKGLGKTPEQIVAKIAPEAQKRGADAKAKADSRGVLGRTLDAAWNRIADIGMAARQVESRITGNDAELKQEQQEQLARENSLDRKALDGNYGGLAVDAATALVPYVGPAGLAARVGLGAVASAGYGATVPTTADGQFGSNVALSALGGAGGVAAVGAAGGVLRSTVKAANFIKTRPARVAGARADEVRMVSQRAGRDIGVDTDVLDQAYIAKAQPILGKRINDSYDGVSLKVDSEFDDSMTSMLSNRSLPSGYKDKIDEFFSGGRTRQSTPFEKTERLVRDEPIDVKKLDYLRRMTTKDLSNPNLNAFEREALQELDSKLSDGMSRAFKDHPEKLSQFREAKRQYDAFRVVRDVVTNTNGKTDSLLDEAKWASAMKRGSNRSRFSRGEMPMQDVLTVLQEAKGQSALSKSKIASVLGKIADVAEWMPLAGIPIRMYRKHAQDIVDNLGVPHVREAFQKLAPNVQAKVMEAAREPVQAAVQTAQKAPLERALQAAPKPRTAPAAPTVSELAPKAAEVPTAATAPTANAKAIIEALQARKARNAAAMKNVAAKDDPTYVGPIKARDFDNVDLGESGPSGDVLAKALASRKSAADEAAAKRLAAHEKHVRKTLIFEEDDPRMIAMRAEEAANRAAREARAKAKAKPKRTKKS